MRKILYVALLFFAFLSSCKGQQESVDLRTGSGRLIRKFEYHQKSNFDVVNGRLNAALVSSNGYLFEITAIPVKAIKCGKNLASGTYDIALIDNRMNKTFRLKSASKPKVTVKCLSNGGYELIFTGDLFNGKEKVKVFARLKGTVNHSQDLKTN